MHEWMITHHNDYYGRKYRELWGDVLQNTYSKECLGCNDIQCEGTSLANNWGMNLLDSVNSKHKCPEPKKILRSLREFDKIVQFGA